MTIEVFWDVVQCEILNSFPYFIGLCLQLHVAFMYPHESVLAH